MDSFSSKDEKLDTIYGHFPIKIMVKTFLSHSWAVALIAVESLGCFPTQAKTSGIIRDTSDPNTINFLAQQTPNASTEVRSFFETGRLRSQDRILFQRPPSDVIPVSSQSNAWQFVIFKEGGCSFWMPPGVLTEETVILDTSLGLLSFRTLASNADDRRYVAAYADSLTQEQLKNPQILLEAIREKVAPANQFELKQDRPITVDDFSGQELTFENSEEVITMRIYLINQKIYALGVRYPKANPLPRQTRAFLNAFELL